MAKGKGGTGMMGKPRATKLVAHAGTPASKKGQMKPAVLVTGSAGSTGHK